MLGRALLVSLNCSTLPFVLTLWCWLLSKTASITIFCVFCMTRPGIEPRAHGPLANILLVKPMGLNFVVSINPADWTWYNKYFRYQKQHLTNKSCTPTYLPSHKSFKSDEQDMRGIAREIRMNTWTVFSNRFLHIDLPVLADQQRLTSTLCGHRMQPRRHTMNDKW